MSGLSDPLKYKRQFGQFNGDFDNRREIETYDNLAAEFAGIKGIPLEYYPINVDLYKDGMDVIYGDNSRPQWDRKYILTAILEEWTQEIQAFNGMGLQNTDDITLYIHRSTFDKIVGIRTLKALITTTDRRGAYGPIAKDEIRTPHNGLVYEVLTGGEHFMDPNAQHFGHKFWYKITCKVRQTSDAPVGVGEQHGAFPDAPLDDRFKGNPQFILPTPTKEEMAINASGTPSQSGTPTLLPTDPVEYVTTGAPPGPGDGSVPEDILLPDGRVADKYQVQPQKDGSSNGDQDEIQTTADQIVDPQTDQNVTPGSPEETKYGPNGRTIPHKREDLFGDW